MNSPILEVVIGIILIYLVLSMICSAIGEMVSQIFNMRAETLWATIRNMLNDPNGTGLAKAIYDNPMVRALSVRESKAEADLDPSSRPKPSYIPADLFSLALTEHLGIESCPANTAQATITAKMKAADLNAEARGAIEPLLQAACGDLDQARKNIESWFDSSMQRASGWYKQQTQRILIFIGFLLAFASNADTLRMVERLWANPAERAAIAAAAKNVVDTAGTPTAENPTGITKDAFEKAQQASGVVLGWTGPYSPSDYAYDPHEPQRFPNGFWEWLLKLVGIVLTGLALSMGAPFWFDLLKRFVNVRSAGPSPVDPAKKSAPVQPDRIPSGQGN